MAKGKNNNNNNSSSSSSSSKKTPQKSAAFGGGKFALFDTKNRKKDNRHHVFCEAMKPGAMIIYISKFNKEEAAFDAPWQKHLEDNRELMEELNISAIISRKGPDGKTPLRQAPGVSYGWKAYLVILGDEKNTEEDRAAIVAKAVQDYNTYATQEHYLYPRKAKFVSDLTPTNMRAADELMLDEDVIHLMMAAYGDSLKLDEMKDNPGIMEEFFADPYHGVNVIETYINQFVTNGNDEEEN